MAHGDLQGRARTSSRNPEAKGECNRCTFWYPLSRLQRQYEYRGASLADTGYLVCPPCLDRPQEQRRTIILPGDPEPRINPRPSPDVTGYATWNSTAIPTSPGNQGFSQYVFGPPTPGNYPASKAAVLSDVALASGIPAPGAVFDRSTVIAAANASQLLMAANPSRSWLLLYGPAAPLAQIALSTAALWGMTTNLPIGPGEALFWSTSQGLAPVYQGALSIISLSPGVAFWAWEA